MAMMNTWVVLTRPEGRNATLAARLQERGMAVSCLPALHLLPLLTQAQQMCWPEDFDLLVFVSGHAARLYLEHLRRWRPDASWPEHVYAATVGDASAEPLYDSGLIPDSHIVHPRIGVAGQDSEGLWRALREVLPDIDKVLVVRGQTGREWLGMRFEEAGVRVARLSLYRREPAVWNDKQITVLLQAIEAGHAPVFLLTSSESVDAVYANMKRLGRVQEWAQCRFIVIHERISFHLQTILSASNVCARHPIMICSPSDDAIYQAICSSMSHLGSL